MGSFENQLLSGTGVDSPAEAAPTRQEIQRIAFHRTVLDPDGVSETLKCPVCMEVFDDPVFCGGRPCQHVFCRECVERALERSECCPVCREDMLPEDLHPHQVIRSLLDEVTVICDRECGWTGRRDNRIAHLSVCPVLLMEQAQEKLEVQARRFECVDMQLTEKDERIAELEAILAEKDRQVVSTGTEVISRQLQIAELERNYRLATQQLTNCRQQLADRNAELERLREFRETGYTGVAGSLPAQQTKADASPPPPTPLHAGIVLDATPEASTLSALDALDLTGAEDMIEMAREDAWLDPEGFSQMNLTGPEEQSFSPSQCNLDDDVSL